MARKTDHPADDLETDDTGGLLAEEGDLDRRALWRIGSWGVGATGAVILAVMANQSSLGLKRDQVAAADLTRQAQQIELVARESQNEARRLASAIDTLNGDRDRLYSRLTNLEQGLDSVTGAIARQGSAPASSSPIAVPQAAQNPPAPTVTPVATTQPAALISDKPAASAAEPGTAAVSARAKGIATDIPRSDAAKTETAKTETAKTETAKTESAKTQAAKVETKTETARPDTEKAETAKPDIAKSDIAKPDTAKPSPSTPLMAARSMLAPPDPAAGKLIEPGKTPAIVAGPIPEVVAATSDEDEATAPKIALQRTEFGVDLGSANSVNGLRALWRGLLKSRSNAPLTTLSPIIVVKEGTNGLGMQLRLVAGPLNDAGAAAKICAVLTENKRSCETAVFDGQRLTLNADASPPATPAPAPRRRAAAKPPAVVEEPPKKPEPSTGLSSFFSRKKSE